MTTATWSQTCPPPNSSSNHGLGNDARAFLVLIQITVMNVEELIFLAESNAKFESDLDNSEAYLRAQALALVEIARLMAQSVEEGALKISLESIPTGDALYTKATDIY